MDGIEWKVDSHLNTMTITFPNMGVERWLRPIYRLLGCSAPHAQKPADEDIHCDVHI